MGASSDQEQAAGPPFDEVWDRLRQTLGIKRQVQLAEMLGISSPSITDAKQRGLFPLNWAYILASKYNISLDFILLGRNAGSQKVTVDHNEDKLLYIDPAVELVDEAIKKTGVSINKKQKDALIEITREELKALTVQMLRAMKRGSNVEGDR